MQHFPLTHTQVSKAQGSDGQGQLMPAQKLQTPRPKPGPLQAHWAGQSAAVLHVPPLLHVPFTQAWPGLHM